MKRRFRAPHAEPGQLLVKYGRSEGEEDLFYCHGGGGANKCDSRLLSHFFEGVNWPDGLNLRQELDDRGYDITTLKFSIMKKEGG